MSLKLFYPKNPPGFFRGFHGYSFKYQKSIRSCYSIALIVIVSILSLSLTGCNRESPVGTDSPNPTLEVSTVSSSQAIPTTLAPPSPTAVPLAVIVNGVGIPETEYQAELAQYQNALGTELSTEDEQLILNDLIDNALLAQEAIEQGFSIENGLLDERIQQLIKQLGSQEALDEWMRTYNYDEVSFRNALARAVAAAWMRDRIIAEVLPSAEQVHAIQILLYNADEANEVYSLLQSGNSFENLAVQYDPITNGDLGWFPRGYLPDGQLEEIAFSLEVGAYSQIVETLAGFHILKVIEKEPERPLSPDAHRNLQLQALQQWLETKRVDSDIQILIP